MGYLYGIYMPVYLVFTLIYSYLSSFGPKHLIPFPWDTEKKTIRLVTMKAIGASTLAAGSLNGLFTFGAVYSGVKGSKYYKGIMDSASE